MVYFYTGGMVNTFVWTEKIKGRPIPALFFAISLMM